LPYYHLKYFKIKKLKNIYIFTKNPVLETFAAKLNIEHYNLGNPANSSLKELNAYKQELKQLALEYNSLEIVFTHYSYDLWGLYFMEMLKSHNKVYFINLDPVLEIANISLAKLQRKSFRIKYLQKLIYCYIFKTKLEVFEFSQDYYALGIRHELLESAYNKIEKPSLNDAIYEENLNYIKKIYPTEPFDILYIDSGEPLEEFDKFNSEKLLECLLSLKKLGCKIKIKPHPNFKLSFMNKEFEIVPGEIPAEIMCSSSKIANIGTTSNSLIFSSSIHKTISLVEMLDYNDEFKKMMIEMLFKQSSIHYPRNMNELIKIL